MGHHALNSCTLQFSGFAGLLEQLTSVLDRYPVLRHIAHETLFEVHQKPLAGHNVRHRTHGHFDGLNGCVHRPGGGRTDDLTKTVREHVGHGAVRRDGICHVRHERRPTQEQTPLLTSAAEPPLVKVVRREAKVPQELAIGALMLSQPLDQWRKRRVGQGSLGQSRVQGAGLDKFVQTVVEFLQLDWRARRHAKISGFAPLVHRTLPQFVPLVNIDRPSGGAIFDSLSCRCLHEFLEVLRGNVVKDVVVLDHEPVQIELPGKGWAVNLRQSGSIVAPCLAVRGEVPQRLLFLAHGGNVKHLAKRGRNTVGQLHVVG